MANRKRIKKDARSAITIHLPASHADFIVSLLSRELDDTRGDGQAGQTADIPEILKSFHNAIELEERQRSLRGKTDRKNPQENLTESEKKEPDI